MPLLSGAEYRFLRFAVDLLDHVAPERGLDPDAAVSHRTHESLEPAVARIRAALWLYEQFPPADDGDAA